MSEKTVVEQLAAANEAMKVVEAKLVEQTAKATALENSVTALTGEVAAMKASAEKSAVELKAAQDHASAKGTALMEAEAKIKGLEARLADPSFKAASTPGTDAVPAGGKASEPETLESLEASYDPAAPNAAAIRGKILALQNQKYK